MRRELNAFLGLLAVLTVVVGTLALDMMLALMRAEQGAFENAVWTGWLQLGCMLAGLGVFLIGMWFVRRRLTLPLSRMAEGIAAMRHTGRLIKLPVARDDELGIVADGFNELGQQVEAQKRSLREHIVELQRMTDELDRLSTLKDEFLITISHQLRTPLTALVQGLELLRDEVGGSLTTRQAELVQLLDENATRLAALVEEALDLSLLKSGRRPLARQPDDLAALLRQTQATWQTVDDARRIRLSCAALPPVYMDAKAVREVMDHLLRNALRHAPAHSDVTVEALLNDDAVDVSVRDQGPGLSPEQLSRLFQPFSHLHTPDAPGSQGSGLGLAFCRQVIERHRGDIRADSAPGRGTAVTFSLPVASPTFLFHETCRLAQEEAEKDGQHLAVLLAQPAESAAEDLLRRNTHRGDQFVRVDDRTLVIIAVTDPPGLSAMEERLRRVLDRAPLTVRLASALDPVDGEGPDQLLAAAQQRLLRQTVGMTAT